MEEVADANEYLDSEQDAVSAIQAGYEAYREHKKREAEKPPTPERAAEADAILAAIRRNVAGAYLGTGLDGTNHYDADRLERGGAAIVERFPSLRHDGDQADEELVGEPEPAPDPGLEGPGDLPEFRPEDE